MGTGSYQLQCHIELYKVGTLAVDGWVGCCIWYSDDGTGLGPSQPMPLLAVPNVTAHPSMASVPITVLLYTVAVQRSVALRFKCAR